MNPQPQHRLARRLAAALAIAGAALAPLAVQAQAAPYPNKPIKVIIPAGPGDTCDLMMRLVAPKVTEKLGQPLVIENRPGSSGQQGLNAIRQSPPDGYTLGCGQGGNLVIVPLAFEKVAYDSQKDFTPIALMGSNFLALVVNPGTPFKTTEDLIAYAKANPGKVSFGSNGEGAFLHFATEMFRIQGNFSYLHVPYKSVAAAITEVLGGQIQATLTSYVAAQPLIAAGKVRMLGVARAQRLPEYPQVPTLAEAVPGFTSGGWFGVIAPAGTPPEIVRTLNREINAALRLPDVRERMKTYGLDVHTEGPEFFAETMRSDFSKWGKLIKDIGFKPM